MPQRSQHFVAFFIKDCKIEDVLVITNACTLGHERLRCFFLFIIFQLRYGKAFLHQYRSTSVGLNELPWQNNFIALLSRSIVKPILFKDPSSTKSFLAAKLSSMTFTEQLPGLLNFLISVVTEVFLKLRIRIYSSGETSHFYVGATVAFGSL